MLRSLLAFAARGVSPPIKTVAEGIETEVEARACGEIGFTHGQGSYLGRPRTVEEI
jgi:EAL domain-containing protein (putative c-di-GMP-specific phosphodiesterase class I)